jgi:hypothetical protein
MKKLFSLALILVLVFSFNAAVFAEAQPAQPKPLTKEEVINSKEFREAVEAAKAEFKAQQENSGPVLHAPAPKVSHINVYAVASPNGGQEIYGFNSNPLSTANDHGGDWIQCVTFQIGYDSSHFGTLAGNKMTNNWSEAIDLDGDRIVDAWAYSWVYEAPSTGGQFVGTVYSINNAAKWTAWINVR